MGKIRSKKDNSTLLGQDHRAHFSYLYVDINSGIAVLLANMIVCNSDTQCSCLFPRN